MPLKSYVLHEKSREFHATGAGWLSIKSFHGGAAHYDVGRGQYEIDDRSYLVLNEGQPYSITIQSRRPVESFCVFFSPGMAAGVYRSLTVSMDRLLDEPDRSLAPYRVFERNYPHDDVLSPVLQRFRMQHSEQGDDAFWVSEQLRHLLTALVGVQNQELGRAVAFPAARVSTRVELYRRLHRAKDFMTACYACPLTLDDIAEVACLSPNHLLRTFKRGFGLSPHQYLTTVRLAEARRLIERTCYPITDICLQVGFTSAGSFSTLFRRKFGVSPSGIRKEGDFEEAGRCSPPVPSSSRVSPADRELN